MLPTSASESSTALDSWIATEAAKLTNSTSYGTVSTEVTNLATWKTWYASGCTNTADESGVYAAARSKLSSNYGNKIKVKVPSNTTIIGLDSDCGFKGGSVQIVGATNVVIRNLVIQDAFDPFPQIQNGDGFNAEWDAIVVQGSSYVWIDHCTLQDKIAVTDDDFDHVKLSDNVEKKYQVFDGLIDVKGNSSGSVPSDFVTISYCKIANHDKVGIIGHSDSSDAYDANHLTVTLHNNYYLNCTQRLPRVRFGHVHVFNNYYQNDGEGRSNSYCFGVGKNAYIYAEKNYFGNKINYVATMMSSSKPGYITLVDNAGVSKLDGVTSTTTWTPSNYYSYEAVSADDSLVEDVIENAGAGVWSVVQ
jgi:pectate lyase